MALSGYQLVHIFGLLARLLLDYEKGNSGAERGVTD